MAFPSETQDANKGYADPVGQSIELIAALHARAESQVDRHQRAIENLTHTLGRPGFLYAILSVVGAWIIGNLAGRHFGYAVWDPPPFVWLQGLISISALVTTIVVLITQKRQGKMAERRGQLNLQMSVLVEQKVTKLIGLLEELRRDLPSVRDREDLEAEAMTEAADPATMLTALEVTLTHRDAIEELVAIQAEAEMQEGE